MKRVLQLAVDARDLASDIRGIGRYTRAILRRLVKRDDIDLTLLVRGPFAFRHRSKLRATLGNDRFHLATQPRKTDLLWHPANGTFFRTEGLSVATIHDVVPFRFPDPDPKRREHAQAPFLRSIHHACRVIAVSEFDRNELLDVFDIPAERIEVIYHGVETFFSPGPLEDLPAQLHQPYLLFVGDPLAEPRKNFEILYRAYRKAFDPDNAPLLVVAGPANPLRDRVYYAGLAAEDALGAGDVRLRALYRGALALCVPSYHETFGMPMTEAMACGTAVVASRASCLPEIAGDAALYAPPHDVDAWVKALREIVSDTEKRGQLRGAGLDRVRRYNWDESARRHAEVFFAP